MQRREEVASQEGKLLFAHMHWTTWEGQRTLPNHFGFVLLFFKLVCFSPQALYDHLMDFLADRGVDNTFADELVELSTALEHQEYITFLEDLKSFVKSQ